MDAFRDASYSEPYIYVVDPLTGKTKTVVDRFYSFIWTERFYECGEFELTGPEEELWTSIIQEGDYLQFSHSDILKNFNISTKQRDAGEVGKYTMIVEQRYTEFNSEKGYTVFAKGRSLESILDRRINLGTGIEATDYTLEGMLISGFSDDEYDHNKYPNGNPTGMYGLGIEILDDDQHGKDYRNDGFKVGDLRFDQTSAHKMNSLIPKKILRDDPGRTYESTLLDALQFNCGEYAIKNRQFNDATHGFEILNMIPIRQNDGSIKYYWKDEVGDGFKFIGHQALKEYDGKMDNLYEIYLDFMKMCEDSKGGVGFRMVADTEQLEPFSIETRMKITGSFYMGEDLTIDGPNKDRGDKVVIFSRDWDNIESMNYIHGQENYKNLIYFDTGLENEPEDLWGLRIVLEGLEDQEHDIDNKLVDMQEEDDYNEYTEEQQKEREKIKDDYNKQQEAISKETERLNKLCDQIKEVYDAMGHRSFYYSVYPRLQDEHKSTLLPNNPPDPYPTGLARREICDNEDEATIFSAKDFEYLGRARKNFEQWKQQSDDSTAEWEKPKKRLKKDAKPNEDGTYDEDQYNVYSKWYKVTSYADWDEYVNQVWHLSFKYIHKPENSLEDDVEASVNYNAIYQPVKDYRVGDIVTVMGIHNNETVRKMRCDEMVYSIEPDGFTVVPTFSILPLKDDVYDDD